MFGISEGLQRLVMAELVRQYLVSEGNAEQAARLVKVTGWRENDIDRYPGTSSWSVEHYVNIFWVDDADGPQCYEFRGSMPELSAALDRTVDEY